MSGLAATMEELGLDGHSEGDHDAGGGAVGRGSDAVAPGADDGPSMGREVVEV
eukprot:SAG22_NODE_584_length_8876_cov_42.811667_3_plen_53_part_00